MPQLYAGTSGWAYPSWKPGFYPPKTPPKKFLGYYATRLNSVELNYTYRHLASEKLLDGWLAATPSHFRFAVKAHQMITHIKRLREVDDFTRRFLSSIEPMAAAGKLGTVLFQLPPFLKCDVALLRDFLATLPRTLRATFEFRHESWFSEEVYGLLRGANAALCIAESEKLAVPDVETADFAYYRLRKPEYSPEERRAIAARAQELLGKGKDVFVYFKHEDTPEGALYAEEACKAVLSAKFQVPS